MDAVDSGRTEPSGDSGRSGGSRRSKGSAGAGSAAAAEGSGQRVLVSMERLRVHRADALRILAVAAAYYVSAQVGLLQELVRDQVTPLWPPTGIALAALFLLGVRTWPGIVLGALVVNATLGPSLLVVAAIAAGNTLAPLCAYWLLRRVRFRIELDRLRDAIALVFLGALGGMLVSATVGSGALVLGGVVPVSDFWPTWSVWWTGDAMGVLVGVPLLFAFRAAGLPRGVPAHRWAEASALLAGTLCVTLVATRTSFDLLFLVFPFLIWAAFRFQLAGAAPCAVVVSTVATFAATQEAGPFAGHDLFSNMVTLQAFNGISALTALVLAATITERNQTHEHIEQLCSQLAEVVTRLEPGESGNRWLHGPLR